MTIHENSKSELRVCSHEQSLESVVERLVDEIDSRQGLCQRQPRRIDVQTFTYQLGYCSQSPCNTRRADIGEGWDRLHKHSWIKLPRLAVDVDIGARKVRREQRRAKGD